MTRNSSLILCLLFLIGLFAFSLVPESNLLALQVAKLLVGLLILVFIPGIYIVNLLNKEAVNNIAFAFIFGFLLQLLNVYVIWWLQTLIGTVNFLNALYIMTTGFVLLSSALEIYSKREIRYTFFLKGDWFLIIPLVAMIFIVIFYPGLDAAFHSDGAAYLDLARRVVVDNSFSSHLVQAPNSWAEAQWSTGMIDHFFGYAGIAVFFALSNVTIVVAKFMLLFVGVLSVFPLYAIANKLLNRSVARLAVLFASLSPIILYHLSLIGGPDIISLLFSLTTLYFFLLAADEEKPSLRISIACGIVFFVSWYAWLLNGYVLLLLLPVIFVLHNTRMSRKQIGLGLFLLLSLILCFFADFFVIGHLALRYLGFPLPLSSLVFCFGLYLFRKKAVFLPRI
jgi:hypothetical protein